MTRRVFTTPDGELEVEFEWSGLHAARYVPVQWNGWRERADGQREFVTYNSEHGWLSDSEVEARRTFNAWSRLPPHGH